MRNVCSCGNLYQGGRAYGCQTESTIRDYLNTIPNCSDAMIAKHVFPDVEQYEFKTMANKKRVKLTTELFQSRIDKVKRIREEMNK